MHRHTHFTYLLFLINGCVYVHYSNFLLVAYTYLIIIKISSATHRIYAALIIVLISSMYIVCIFFVASCMLVMFHLTSICFLPDSQIIYVRPLSSLFFLIKPPVILRLRP